MLRKIKLLKASSVLLYVASFLYFVVAACSYSVGAYDIAIPTVIFAVLSLVLGLCVLDIREKRDLSNLGHNGKIYLLVVTILSIICCPAFICNLVALCSKKEDKYVLVEKEVAPVEVKEKKARPIYATRPFITACSSLALIFAASAGASGFEHSAGKVEVTNFTLTQEMTKKYNDGKVTVASGEKAFVIGNEDSTYSCTMYRPKTATADNKLPVVFVLPGFTRTKATMAQYAIELSRRGAVVFTNDPGGQGSTTETSTAGANGIEYLVQYVYNNPEFDFCDKDRMGATGHSAGGGNVITLASDFTGSTYSKSIIKAVYNSGYIKTSAANKFKSLKCNAAMSYAYYDEGAFRYQEDQTAFEVIADRFINEVANERDYELNGTMGRDLVADFEYGDMSKGTYRVVHREKINHCFEMYDRVSISNTINFFVKALEIDTELTGMEQVWFGKELLNGIALASAFTFIIALIGTLMKIPFFATIKYKKEEETGELETRGEVKAAAPKTLRTRITFWVSMIVSAVIACFDYIPLAYLSVTSPKLFPVGNSSSVYTTQFPARMINAILLWAVINGLIGLVIYFLTMGIDNIVELVKAKKENREPVFDWGKIEPLKVHGKSGLGVLANVGKIILLIAIGYWGFYGLVHLNYLAFHQDFRFMLVSAAPLNARMLATSWEYIPLIAIFYLSNSIRVNGSIAKEGWAEWKVLVVSALANSIGLGFILLINYFCYFTTGSPFFGYASGGTEVWLYINMVFGLVTMMFILPIFNRILYKRTGSVYVGALICAAIFVTMTIAASVSYIPGF